MSCDSVFKKYVRFRPVKRLSFPFSNNKSFMLSIRIQMSHISTKFCSTSESSCQAQTELPRPVFTYVLVKCLKTLWLEFQGKPRCKNKAVLKYYCSLFRLRLNGIFTTKLEVKPSKNKRIRKYFISLSSLLHASEFWERPISS